LAQKILVGGQQNFTVFRPYHGQASQRFWRYRENIETQVQGLYRGMIIYDAVENVVDFYKTFYRLMGKDRCFVMDAQIKDLTPHSMANDRHDEKTYKISIQFAHQVKPNMYDNTRVLIDAHESQ